MKCERISQKFNRIIVQNLPWKKIKINAISQSPHTEKVMPAMPKAKSSSISENDYEEMRNKEQLYEAKVKLTASAGSEAVTAVGQDDGGGDGVSETVTPLMGTAAGGGKANSASPATSSSKPKSSAPTRRSANDFRFGKTIGEGSFSTVYLAKDIHTGKECAIKVCDKNHILREGKQEYIKREREVMNVMSGCPGFVNLYCTFQDSTSLYFVMTHAKNGDLLPHINKVGSFDRACTRFYAAELVLALENMHKRGVIHRDLKPENVLLDDKMHTLIADFGSSKVVEGSVSPQSADSPTAESANGGLASELANGLKDGGRQDGGYTRTPNPRYQRGRKNSFVGTAQYVSPEILKGQASTSAVDLWALGCIVYQMVSGLPPFRGGSEYLIFQQILKQELTFPDGFDGDAKDLVERLLVLDPCARIGAKDRNRYDSIRSHPFFKGIDWDRMNDTEPPKIYPYLPGLDETRTAAYRVPDTLEPGLGEKQLTRLLGLDLGGPRLEEEVKKKSLEPKSIADVSEMEKRLRLEKQKTDKWDAFADGELILKQGFVNKRKGLFARKRMLLLTTGPRLIYIDPAQMVKKGEIPWSDEVRVEPKNFKIFFVHTPNRTYYLEDPDGFALKWCDAIKDVRKFTYGITPASERPTGNSSSSSNNGEVTDYRYSSS